MQVCHDNIIICPPNLVASAGGIEMIIQVLGFVRHNIAPVPVARRIYLKNPPEWYTGGPVLHSVSITTFSSFVHVHVVCACAYVYAPFA